MFDKLMFLIEKNISLSRYLVISAIDFTVDITAH